MVTPQFIFCNGVMLAFYELNKQSNKLIFFIHGNSASSDSWTRQVNDAAFAEYRLILLDLPGHGQSGSSPEPEIGYSMPALGYTIAEAIKKLSCGLPYIIIGASLGTNMIAEALKFNLHPKGLVLAGPCITGGRYKLENIVKSGTAVHVVLADEAPQSLVEQYASEIILNPEDTMRRGFVGEYFRVKAKFRSNLAASIQKGHYNDQVNLIKALNIPVLVVFGEDEKVIDANYLDDAPFSLWNDTVFKISGASHFVYIDQAQAFNSIVIGYIEDRYKYRNSPDNTELLNIAIKSGPL